MKELPYKGGYSIDPWGLNKIVSANASRVLSKIYEKVFQKCDNLHDAVAIPMSFFNDWVSSSRNTVNNAIDELEAAGVINVYKKNRSATAYSINWDELSSISQKFVSINAKCAKEINGLAINPKTKEVGINCSRIDDLVAGNPKENDECQRADSSYQLIRSCDSSRTIDTNSENYALINTNSTKVGEQLIRTLPNYALINTNSDSSRTIDTNLSPDEQVREQLIRTIESTYQLIRTQGANFGINVQKQGGSIGLEIEYGSKDALEADYVLINTNFVSINTQIGQSSYQSVQPIKNIENKKMVETRSGSVERSETITGTNSNYREEKEIFEKGQKNFESYEEDERQETSRDNLKNDLEIFEEHEQELPSSKKLKEIDEEQARRIEESNRRYQEDLKKLDKNPYKNKPIIFQDDLERMIDNPENCVGSPARLFLFELFSGITDWYRNNFSEIEYDEEGNEVETNELPAWRQMYDAPMPSDDFYDIMTTAWSNLEGYVKKGEFDDGFGEPLKLGFDRLPEIDIWHICDWKMSSTGKEFLVSTAGFRDIEKEDVKVEREESKASSREQRRAIGRQNRSYAAFLMQADKSQLNQLEGLQARFLEKFVVFDEFYHTVGYRDKFGDPLTIEGERTSLTWYIIQPFMKTQGESNELLDAFYKTMDVPGGYKEGSNINNKLTPMFSYKETQRQSQLLSMGSSVSEDAISQCLQ